MLNTLQALGYAWAADRVYIKLLPNACAPGYSGGTVVVVQLHTQGLGRHSVTHELVMAGGERVDSAQPATPFSGLHGMLQALEHELTACGQLGFQQSL